MITRYLFIILACFSVLSCENTQLGGREKGLLGGAAIGAGLGAIIGAATGDAGVGTAIGGGIGALTGAVVGNEVDKADQREQQFETQLSTNDQRIRENQLLIDELKKRGADVRSTDRGVVINLPDVLFEFDSSRLAGDAYGTIRDIAEVVAGISNRPVAVEGHTDSVGTVGYNQKLSEDRARSVARELVAQGVSRGRITTRGYGESTPVASNSTSVGRARNRRVEVIIEN